jgi:hypothetical protein
VDAVVFMGGLIAGIWVFAEAYTWLAGFVWSGEVGNVTLADLLGVPFWVLAGLVVAVALAMFWLIWKVEGRIARQSSGKTEL